MKKKSKDEVEDMNARHISSSRLIQEKLSDRLGNLSESEITKLSKKDREFLEQKLKKKQS